MQKINKLLQTESAPGILLIVTGIVALLLANSPVAGGYFSIIEATRPVNVIFIVNEILMTIFFLYVGLEIKHEFLTGHLSNVKQMSLPAIAAVGGVIVPALFFIALNRQNPIAINGWAIPTATDIAFALGVIILLGKKLPLQLKILLLAISIIDDIIAILIIAVFYTQRISELFLVLALCATLLLCWLNYKRTEKIAMYILVGVALWFCMLNSGVHATISGVVIAFIVPLAIRKNIYKQLSCLVSFFILPLFAFVNAGISLQNISLAQVTDPVPMGVVLGLIFGKQLGVFSFAWLAVKFKFAELPKSISWQHVYGMAIICGIGFTMSVFIGNLAYKIGDEYIVLTKLGVLIGSTVCAIWGYLYLWRVLYKKH